MHFGPVADLGVGERIDADAKTADIDAVVAGTATIDAASVASAPPATKGFLGAEYPLFTVQLNERGRTPARLVCEANAKDAHDPEDAWAPGKGRPGGRADEVAQPLAHLPRRLVRERDREDLVRLHAARVDQMRDAVGEDARLPGSRPGDDEKRHLGGEDGDDIAVGVEGGQRLVEDAGGVRVLGAGREVRVEQGGRLPPERLDRAAAPALARRRSLSLIHT